MFCWQTDDGPALNVDLAAFFLIFGVGGWGTIPVINRQTFLDSRMQSYNRTLDLHNFTNIK